MLGEILWVVPERPAGPLELVGEFQVARTASLVPDRSPDLVQGVSGPAHHVIRVSALDRVGAALRHHVDDPTAAIATHPAELAAALLAQSVEELVQGGLVAPLGRPHQPPAVVIDDHRDIALPPLP